jgi:hypothetical protein
MYVERFSWVIGIFMLSKGRASRLLLSDGKGGISYSVPGLYLVPWPTAIPKAALDIVIILAQM